MKLIVFVVILIEYPRRDDTLQPRKTLLIHQTPNHLPVCRHDVPRGNSGS